MSFQLNNNVLVFVLRAQYSTCNNTAQGTWTSSKSRRIKVNKVRFFFGTSDLTGPSFGLIDLSIPHHISHPSGGLRIRLRPLANLCGSANMCKQQSRALLLKFCGSPGTVATWEMCSHSRVVSRAAWTFGASLRVPGRYGLEHLHCMRTACFFSRFHSK